MSGAEELTPWPREWLRSLGDQDELWVSSRGPEGVGSVRMWFAVAPPGFIYLLTPSYTLKADRWRSDPWVRLRRPGDERAFEGEVREQSWEEAAPLASLLTQRFSLAGAARPAALRWMLEDGSRRLLKTGRRQLSGSDPVELVQS